MMRRVIAAMVLPLLIAGCVEKQIAQREVQSALINAGLSPATSQCIAHRVVDQLSGKQLHKLAELGARRRSAEGYIFAVQRINDPQITRVTLSTAALCATGLTG